MDKRIYHIPIFVPHMGCPHDCVFCNQKKITGHTDVCDAKSVTLTIEKYLQTINNSTKREDSYIEVAFFGGSFTGIDINVQKEYLSAVQPFLKSNQIDSIRCSTRPDYINDEILNMLKSFGMGIIELGVQSADDNVLKLSNRGHTFEDVEKAVNLIKNHGIQVGLQMMTGLPGDTKQTSVETAKKIADLKPRCVRIYPTLVMEDTKLFEMYKSGSYKVWTVKEAVDVVSRIIPVFEQNGIDIIRIGLQTTDNVNEKTVKGPYHPAFAELCYSRLERNNIECYVKNNNLKNTVLNIKAPKKLFSKIVGHKKENIIYFKNNYNIDIILTEHKEKIYG